MSQTAKKITFVDIVEKLNISSLPASYASYVDWYNEVLERETRLQAENNTLYQKCRELEKQISELKQAKNLMEQNVATCRFIKLHITK